MSNKESELSCAISAVKIKNKIFIRNYGFVIFIKEFLNRKIHVLFSVKYGYV